MWLVFVSTEQQQMVIKLIDTYKGKNKEIYLIFVHDLQVLGYYIYDPQPNS